MSLQLTFGGLEPLEAFKARIERMKHAFAPARGQPLKPVDLFSKLFDLAESYLSEQLPVSITEVTEHFLPSSGIHIMICTKGTVQLLLYMKGVYTEGMHTLDQYLFVCELTAFSALCQGLVKPCVCHWTSPKWEICSTVQVHLVMCVQLLCVIKHRRVVC